MISRTVLRRGALVARGRTSPGLLRARWPQSMERARGFAVHTTTSEATGNTGNIHRSDAEVLINEVPVIEVDGPVALCDGGGGSLGHPIEFIQLNSKTPDIPAVCKYCGLRYIMKKH